MKAICVILATFIVIAVIVYKIGEKKAAEYKERDERKIGEEKEEQKEPEPPTLSNVGVPDKTEESTGMDILKGEERYSKLVERSLDNS